MADYVDYEDGLENWVQQAATSGTGGEGDPVDSISEIQEWVLGQLESIGNVVTDVGDIPEDASYRVRGSLFTDPQDVAAYLDEGGLIFYDDNGNPQPHPAVYLYYHPDPDYDNKYIIEVWIRKNSE